MRACRIRICYYLYGSGCGSFRQEAKKIWKILIFTVLWLLNDLLSLKTWCKCTYKKKVNSLCLPPDSRCCHGQYSISQRNFATCMMATLTVQYARLYCSQIHSPWLGDKVDSGIGLSYRPASLCSQLAGRYDNPLPESTIFSQSGTMNLTTG